MPSKGYKLIKEVARPDLLSSQRDMELVVTNKRWDFKLQPLLTVEFYVKWYELFLITQNEARFLVIESVHFGFLEDICPSGISASVDHVPNPLVVRLFSRQNGYEIDELAEDLIKGRWQNEVVEQDVMECDRCEGKGVVVPARLVPAHSRMSTTCRACKGLGETQPNKRTT